MCEDIFVTEYFLLDSEEARLLYHHYAKDLPIIDYHCHLPPAQVADNHQFRDMTEIWLAGDHYKWRAMRANGVAERYCTGDAPSREKFDRWAETVPWLMGNPLYHWTHLELSRVFGIGDRLFGPDSADYVWQKGNALLAQPEYTARGIMLKMNVALVCTTDDPVDDLEAHRRIAEDPSFPVRVLPTWRPDRAMAVEDPATFRAYVERLESAANMSCPTLGDFLEALRRRQLFFHERGCRVADHGIEIPYAEDCAQAEAEDLYKKVLSGTRLPQEACLRFRSFMLAELLRMNHAMDWAQQLHIGPIRNTNTRMFRLLGPDAGYDSVGDAPLAKSLARLLDRVASTDQLTRTILYAINPAANMVMATMTGNFQDGSMPGKMQFGSGWWFNDQLRGMEDQLETLSQTGLLSRFVGMLTDSRSFLSYPRHEYFRRILCNKLGEDIRRGRLPKTEITWIGAIVRNICWNNANRYFRFGLPER
ncbi:MAG TPA: glucuronate isomerase [Candidatus Hydrogenedentes bacterium]|nr:glucuronate isomerase [Candidatus Hydrogenedentota bacterium]